MDFLISSAAAVGAVIITNPLDVIKTRLQLQGELQAPGQYNKVYKNVFHGSIEMIKNEGIRGLQKGFGPAAIYQVVMNGTRLSLYGKLQANGYLNSRHDGSLSNVRCIAAGAGLGVFSGFIASPFYLAKVQLQSRAASNIAVGTQHHHQTVMGVLKAAYSGAPLGGTGPGTGSPASTSGWRGLRGLYRGATTSLCRVGAGSAAQLYSYTKCRDALHSAGVAPFNSWSNALAGAMLSGVAVTACMTPFDVLSTRMYNQGLDSRGRGLLYRNLWHCLVRVVRSEGPLALYKGWAAVYLRIGPHSFLSLFFWDVLKRGYSNWENGGAEVQGEFR